MITIFWLFYLGVLAIGTIGIIFKGFKTSFEIFDFIFSVITWIGLFGYVTNNQILTPLLWKCVFVIGLLWDFVFGFKKFNEEVIHDDGPQAIKIVIFGLTSIFFVGPLYLGLFIYAFK